MHQRIRRVILIAMVLLLSSCNTNTDEYTEELNEKYPDGYTVKVNYHLSSTTYTGAFTGINYGTSRNFSYRVLWSPGRVKWDQSLTQREQSTEMEPRHMIPCRGKFYMEYYTRESVVINDKPQYKTVRYYLEHIDNRYFFKLLGEQYWIKITAEALEAATKSCTAYVIPNKHELTLDAAIK